MLTIDLGTIEYYDDKNNQFVYDKGGIVRFEYSLKVMYNWESKWKKPFLKGKLSDTELVDFYMMMALDPIKEQFITDEVMVTLSTYIGDSHTATTFSSFDKGNKSTSTGKLYTSEELYALMFRSHIPIEFENRNLNRLLVILRIMSNYDNPPKKMSREDIYKQNAELNRQRREQLKSKG